MRKHNHWLLSPHTDLQGEENLGSCYLVYLGRWGHLAEPPPGAREAALTLFKLNSPGQGEA